MAGISTFTRETAAIFSATASPRSSSARCCARTLNRQRIATRSWKSLSGKRPARNARRGSASKETEAVGRGGGLAPAGRAELAQNVGHVHAGGLHGDEQLAGDLPVAVPGRDEPEHLVLAGRESQRGPGNRGVAGAPGR